MGAGHMTIRTIDTSIEFEEGYRAYGEGIDGYDARPYPDLTQEMTDWFAGWISAKDSDQLEYKVDHSMI